MSMGPPIRIPTRMAGRDIDKEHRVSSPLGVAVAAASMLLVSLGAAAYGATVTIVLVALVTSALTATSIVDNVRRTARGAKR